tara:strand:+ start:4234 stop:4473 length:240 start_codon:yes stop_codon:yes gene_type:complete
MIGEPANETHPPDEFLRKPGFQVLSAEELDYDPDDLHSPRDIADAMKLLGFPRDQIDATIEVLSDPDHWISNVNMRFAN